MTKAVSKTAPQNPKSKTEQLDEIGIDAICERIRSTESQASIARSLNMSDATLINWLNADSERSARARDARADSAFECDELALQALYKISDDSTQAAVARQREIASHHRWRAKTRNPQKFGDKQTIDLNAVVTEMTDEQRRERLAELMQKTGKS